MFIFEITYVMMKQIIVLLLFLYNLPAFTQYDKEWFFITAKDTITEIPTIKDGEVIEYIGDNKKLESILSKYNIYKFKKTYRNAKKEHLKKTFFVMTDDAKLMEELLLEMPETFIFGEHIEEKDKKIFEPNDYGLTSTIGDNLGAQERLDYLDFLNVPKAWYYTTGSPDVLVGISDGSVDTLDVEFKDRIKVFRKSHLTNGHGLSIAETAVGKGDNAHGIAGVCYSCNIAATSFGSFKNLEQLLELSNAGARVINCSWGSTTYYKTAQEVINEMYNNGTIIVAAGHNKSFSETKGKLLYYPASYDNVISVSSGLYRYKNYLENIKQGRDKKGNDYYYVENIAGYVGRTAGFKNNDTLHSPYIYPVSIRNLNSEIDILGPSTGIYAYSVFVLNKSHDDPKSSATSPVVPLVTGTIGLMFSLYPCLPTNEVESILKMTSWNIDHIEANKPYKGLYGSGMLQTGDAVEMVFQLYNEKETAYIDNQNFSRWDFKLTSLSKEIIIQNQKFTDSASLNLTAKNRIVIKENTVLKPGVNGKIALKINPKLEKECDLVLRDSSILED